MGPFYTGGAGFLKEKETGREKKKGGAGAGGAQVVWWDEHSSETHVG